MQIMKINHGKNGLSHEVGIFLAICHNTRGSSIYTLSPKFMSYSCSNKGEVHWRDEPRMKKKIMCPLICTANMFHDNHKDKSFAAFRFSFFPRYWKGYSYGGIVFQHTFRDFVMTLLFQLQMILLPNFKLFISYTLHGHGFGASPLK